MSDYKPTKEEIHEAGIFKYKEPGLCWLRKLSTGNFAIYVAGEGRPRWIGHGNDIAKAYSSIYD